MKFRPSTSRTRSRHRGLLAEQLETRRLLIAEGETFEFSQNLDAAAFVGAVSASVDWGDGNVSPATVSDVNTTGPLKATIRYDYDSGGFFNSSRRALLQAAADGLVEMFTDSLSAITPTSGNTWTATFANPSNRSQQLQLTDINVAANEIIIFAGAQPLPGNQLAEGSFGGYNVQGTSQAFIDAVATRGQTGAAGGSPTDFGPWGGALTFDSDSTDWFFGTDVSSIQPDQTDFISVAMHEIAHLLGFGTSPSWQRLTSGNAFTGPKAQAAYDSSGNVPLHSGRGHWADDTSDDGSPTLMDSTLSLGRRIAPTQLDLAALDDIGWTLANRSVTVTGNHVYADNGSFPINVTLHGSEIGEDNAMLTAGVTNVPPTLDVGADVAATVGQPISLIDMGRISDPGFHNTATGTAETFDYSIDWGDGSEVSTGTATIDQSGNANRPTLASFDGSHVYETTGTKTVRVTVTDDDNGSAVKNFQITVGAPPTLELSTNQSTVAEDAGSEAMILTISRVDSPTTAPLVVTLQSSDATEATIVSSVTIPAGQSSTSVSVSAVDDTLLDGTQSVTLTASAAGFDNHSTEVTVSDAESISATFTASSIAENAAAGSVSLVVRRSNTDTEEALDLSISGGTALGLPDVATIPAGQQQVSIPAFPQDDDLQRGPQTFEYHVTAPAYPVASAMIVVEDDDPPFFQNPDNPLDVDGSGSVVPLDALRIINELTRTGSSRALDPLTETLGENFFDTNGDYLLTPLDALVVINHLSRSRTISGEPEHDDHEDRHDSILAAEFDWLRTELEDR